MARLTTAQLAARFGSNAKSSMEDNDVNININADVDGEGDEGYVDEADALDTSDTPEAAELDVADAGAEVEDTVEDTEAVSESIDGLESLYLTLHQISEEGLELGAGGAALLRNHVQQLTGKYGLDADDVGIASQEDLTMFPNSAIQDSMEGIGETIKAAYQKLIDFLKKIGTMISTFVKSLFDAATAAEGKIKKLEKILESGSVKTKKVSIPPIISAGNGVDTKGIELLIGMTAEFERLRFNTVVSEIDKIADENKAIDIYNKLTKGLEAFDGIEVGCNTILRLDKKGILRVESGEAKKGSVENLSKADCQSYLKLAAKAVDVVKAYRSTESDRKKSIETLVTKLKAEAKAANGTINQSKESKVIAIVPKRFLISAMNKIVSAETKCVMKCGTAANALCNVVAKFTSKKAEAKAE